MISALSSYSIERKLAKGRLKGTDKFCLQLSVQLVSRVFVLHISTHIRIEQQRIADPIRINTRAADRHINIQADLGIHNAERNRIRCAKLVVNQLLCIEIVDSLILTCIAAKCKTLADCRKCRLDAVSKTS